MKHSRQIFIGYLLIAIVMLTSCKRQETGFLPGTALNFFNTSDGIFYFPGTKAIYIDKMDTSLASPGYFLNRIPTGETFPSLGGESPSGTVPILYMRVQPGDHRFIFTNGNKHPVADTTFNLTAGLRHSFYIYDHPDSLLYHCRVLHLVEKESAPVDVCRFRLLHLSPDLDTMNAFFVIDDGSRRFPASLPINLTYAGYSNYVTLDQSVVGKDGNAYLQFFSGTDTAKIITTATIPFRKGRSYAIVVNGLVNTRIVQYKDPANPDKVARIRLDPSILARVRTVN